jgi:Fe-S-cluster containining protein
LEHREKADSPEIDLAEIRGRTYKCIDDCALCCLCQPELLPEEERHFRASPALAEAVTDQHISNEVRGTAIKLRGAHGACWFLKDRRCRIYSERPHFCRAFPVNVFVGWRIQLNANLSCRGMDLPGERLEDIGKDILSGYGEKKLSEELASARKVFSDFVKNSRDAWVAQSFSSVRDAGRTLVDELGEEVGLGRIMTYAEKGRTAQNAPARDIIKQVRRTESEADIYERALIDGTELFDLPDLSLLPIYIDDKLTWRIFRLADKKIVGYVLSEDGKTEESSRIDPSEVELLPMNRSAQSAAKRYIELVNSRDCFLGHAAYLCDSENYDYNFAQVYLGALANNSLDLWWRSSFLAHLNGRTELGEEEIKEGIIFFDMDLLDLPTIGAFI